MINDYGHTLLLTAIYKLAYSSGTIMRVMVNDYCQNSLLTAIYRTAYSSGCHMRAMIYDCNKQDSAFLWVPYESCYDPLLLTQIATDCNIQDVVLFLWYHC